MATKRLVLSFPEDIVTKPITYRLVKDFDIEFNILRAEITTDMEGKILIEIKGSKEKLKQGIDYLNGAGVTIQEATKDILVDKEKCVDCGVCASLCITDALYIDKKDRSLEFDRDKCILCGFCQNCCPVDAIKLKI